MDPQDWLRQCVQYDEDVYEILGDLTGQLPKEEIAALVAWLRSDPDLTTTRLQSDEDGLSTDQWPSHPEV